MAERLVRITKADFPQLRPNDVAKAVRKGSDQVMPALYKLAFEKAENLQGRLKSAIEVEYRGGTGRLASGIRAWAYKTKDGAALKVTMINYREANFLTTMSQYPYFKDFPVPPYFIFAKGAEQFIGPKEGARRRRGSRSWLREVTGLARSTLKVPFKGMFAARTGPGGLSRSAFPVEPGVNPFYYPLWVRHPAIKRDVIADTVSIAGEEWKQENYNQAQIIFDPAKMGAGIQFKRPRVTKTGEAAIVQMPRFLMKIQ